MRKFIPIIALAFLLASCGGGVQPQMSEEGKLYDRATKVCTIYKSTVNTLAALRATGSLTETQVATFEKFRPLFAVCRPGGLPENLTGDWVKMLDDALFELMLIEGESK